MDVLHVDELVRGDGRAHVGPPLDEELLDAALEPLGVLIGMFENDMFYCTPAKPCGCANHISVRPPRGAGYRSRDAAWWPVEFASLVARVLANESRSLAA